MENQYIGGEFPKKGGAWIVSRFKRGVFKKERVIPWLIGIKYPKQIRLRCTNAVILLIIVIIITWDY